MDTTNETCACPQIEQIEIERVVPTILSETFIDSSTLANGQGEREGNDCSYPIGKNLAGFRVCSLSSPATKAGPINVQL